MKDWNKTGNHLAQKCLSGRLRLSCSDSGACLDNVVGNAVSGNLVTVFLRARHPRVSSTWMCVF